jgi:hypothetical protein
MGRLDGLGLIALAAAAAACSRPVPKPSHPAAPDAAPAPGPPLFDKAPAPIPRVDATGSAAPANPQDPEPNDTWREAATLELEVPAYGLLAVPKGKQEPGDEDWYAVTIPGADPVLLRVELSGATELDLVLEWMAPGVKEPTTVLQADLESGRPGPEVLPALRLKPGVHYFRAREARYRGKPPRGSAVPYRIVALASPDRPEVDAEPNDTLTTAVVLAMASAGRGFLGHSKDQDLWRVEIGDGARGQRLRVELRGIAGLALKAFVAWEPGGPTVVQGQGKQGEGLTFRNLMPPGGTQAVLVSVSALRGGSVSEPYEVALRPEEPPVGLVETEPNHDALAPTVLPGPGRVTGFVDRAGDLDRYELEVKEPSALHATLEPPLDGRLSLELAGSDQTSLGRSAGADPGQAEVLRGFGVTPGRWQLLVRGRGGFKDPTRAYALGIELTPAGRAELEPNDKADAPSVSALVAGEKRQGWIPNKGDQDWWRLEVPLLDPSGAPAEGRIVTLRLEPPAGMAMRASLLGAGGQVLAQLENAARESTFTHLLAPGVYHVLITAQDPARFEPATAYELELLPTP